MMAYGDEDSVSQLKIVTEDCKCDYEILIEREALGDCGGGIALTSSSSASGGGSEIWSSLRRWAKLVFVVILVSVLGVCFFIWIGPFLMNKEVIPILNRETETFNNPTLAVLIFASVALFPTFLLPSTPSMWVAGMTFGYGFGFLLIIGGVIIGTSLPFFFGSLFYHKIEEWLQKFPKKASILRLAGEGNWFNQFKAVVLLRISPFPYVVYNYCAVATGVNFGPYLFGTLVGILPEIFVAIYTGIMIRTLADASNDRRSLSAQQIMCTVVGFLLTVITTVGVTLYAKRRLSKLQKEEQQPLIHTANFSLMFQKVFHIIHHCIKATRNPVSFPRNHRQSQQPFLDLHHAIVAHHNMLSSSPSSYRMLLSLLPSVPPPMLHFNDSKVCCHGSLLPISSQFSLPSSHRSPALNVIRLPLHSALSTYDSKVCCLGSFI
ncbi:unnamed protein product [Lactuca virosa]|uniref:VTT domain-containing protein n=1 Tax=Lactuca virosa TaxID=75947 RepID=A0AAU9M3Y5_9ASTR|nr:unnamed protein product [Lactuca virosa]